MKARDDRRKSQKTNTYPTRKNQQQNQDQLVLALESRAIAQEIAELGREMTMQLRQAEALLRTLQGLGLVQLPVETCPNCRHGLTRIRLN